MVGVLIEQLHRASGPVDGYLAKRGEARISLRVQLPLEMRMEHGRLVYVTALNVSQNGIGFHTREHLRAGDQVELRLSCESPNEFEPYEVTRVTQTVSGFKVGAVAR